MCSFSTQLLLQELCCGPEPQPAHRGSAGLFPTGLHRVSSQLHLSHIVLHRLTTLLVSFSPHPRTWFPLLHTPGCSAGHQSPRLRVLWSGQAPSPRVQRATHTWASSSGLCWALVSGVSYATSEGWICLVPVFVAERKFPVQTVPIAAETQRKDTKFIWGWGR